MATSRGRVLEEIGKTWREFNAVLAEVPAERMQDAGAVGLWSVKDLIGHVTTWEAEMMDNVRRFLEGRDMHRYPDVDAFNKRTVLSKRTTPLADLLDDLRRTHEEAVQFVNGLPDGASESPEVEFRIRIDTYEHYPEHAQSIRAWLDEISQA